ncbi:MAG: OFA family MFS transporter [Proteobacteria bacterium]|jgi:MFS family permease|nr:OFA family MFS transporter [Pseudomonadota bacterium]
MSGLLSRERIIAPADYNRWRVPVASVAIHLCIGSVYAWSIYNPSLTRVFGVVTSSGDDWNLSQVVWVFTVAIVFLGLAAAFAGKWLENVGPRKVGVVAACCWGGGYIVGGFGIATHQLWLLYLGYGVIGGCGLGLGYVSPVSTLIRWFPDRRGMAAGMAIMGFGGGAMIGTPLKEYFIRLFYRAPEFLGAASDVNLVTEAGRRFVEVGGVLQEVVVAGAAEVRNMTIPGPEGVYVVNSGASGVAETFFVIGLIYLVVMLLAAFSYRLPPAGWKPAGWEEPAAEERDALISGNDVDIDQALKTPQFYQLWVVLCLNVTAGIGVLGVARTMITEIFGTTLPNTVDAAFAATYVVMISAFNMVGRFIWASTSDYIGRRNTYWIFFVLGIALYLSIPFTAAQVSADPSIIWLIYFYAATMIIFTMYGGGFATIPAYLADIFGTRYVGGIHGRLLTAWSTAGVLGPLAITSLRQSSVNSAITDLMATINPNDFLAQFGAPVDQLEVLVAQNSVTISRLMEIAPAGTTNPTSGLYNSTMILMAALLAIALVSNALMKPVEAKHHIVD